MKHAAPLFFFLLCLVLLGGCMSPDDHDFYAKGWLNPRDLDKAPPSTMPMRPTARDTQPGGVAPSATASTSNSAANSEAVRDGWVPPTAESQDGWAPVAPAR